ncbi:MAG TPA: hypothetical protein VEY12_04085 [Thermoplasmata archaeon]|nr:hypothetical protein [Thermoplasmata archaeon]
MPFVIGALLAAALLAPGGLRPAGSGPIAGDGSGVAGVALPGGGPQPLAASVSLALTTSTPDVNPKDTAIFALFFNSTGNQSSPHVWINLTAFPGLSFLGDTAVGNVTGYPHYHFTSVGLGLHAFQMSFRVAIGTPPGSTLAVWATMVYADGTGSQHFVGPAWASALVGIATKQLYLGWSVSPPGILTPVPPAGGLLPAGTFALAKGGPAVSFDLSPVLARSFRVLNATAVLYLEPLTTPTSLDVNLTLIDVDGPTLASVAAVEQTTSITGPGYWTLFYTFPMMNHVFGAGHRIRLQVTNTASSGQSALLATNATADPSRLVLQTTTYVSVDSLVPPASPATYLSPKSSLVITANVSDPFGSGEIREARLNLTGPGGLAVRWLNLTPVAVDPSSPSAWKVFQYSRPPALANGTDSIELTAIERNGVLDIAAGAFTVRAPSFDLRKLASVAQAKSNVRFTYSIWYNNTGTGPAGTAWINDTLPSQVSFVSSNPWPNSISGSTYAWVVSPVSVGSHVIQLTVRVRNGVSGVAYIRNWASLNFTDEAGFPWSPAMSHADVVLNGPVMSLGVASIPVSMIHSNESAVFTINMTNTGDAANAIWLNVTMPAGLTYVGDTSGSLGANRTLAGNQVRLAFPNMPSGALTPVSWVFTLTARAGSSLERGTVLTSRFRLNDTSINDVSMPEQVVRAALTVASPAITRGAVGFGVASAVPVVPLPVYVNFTIEGNEPASRLWINLTLDPALRFVDATVSAVASANNVQLIVTNASVGEDSVRLNVSADPSVMDRQVLVINGTLTASDGYGNVLAAVAAAPGSVTVALPIVTFGLSPVTLTVEAGGTFQYTIRGGNSGSGIASVVWLNLSLPAGVAYASDTFGVRPVVLGSNYSWVWRNFAPGTYTSLLNLTATGAAADRSIVDLVFSARALDLGGNPQPASTFSGQVAFVGPAWLLSISADHGTTLAGEICNYTLRIQNVGSTPAHFLWLLLPLDPDVQLITHTAPVPATGTTVLNWTFQDVQPGQTIRFNVLVKVNPGAAANTYLAESLEAHYTNSLGVVLGYVRSAPAQVEVQADATPLVYILLLGSLAGAGIVVFVYRRYRVQIEDVFLIYRDGILISHLTNTAPRGKDEDVLSGMLTAVQDFVTDAFTYGEHRELHQLEFGDYHILIERGKSVYLAVVYAGRDSGLIRKKVRAVLDKIEASYGAVFARWDGDMHEVEGTQSLLREGFLDEEHPWSLVKPKAP